MTGQDFKDRRISIGVSQTEIAKKAGVTWRTIKTFEETTDNKIVRIIEAYGLGIMPNVYDTSVGIDDFENMFKKVIEQRIGRKCKVKINIELCEKEKA